MARKEQNTGEKINQILSQIEYDYKQELVPVCPVDGAVEDDCFNNVLKYVEKEGGKAISGWRLSTHPKYVMAEYHCVWENLDGDLIDITPYNQSEIKEILFASQKNFKWNGSPVANKIINTSSSALVDDFIFLSQEFFNIHLKYTKSQPYDKELFSYIKDCFKAVTMLLEKNGSIDDKCPCGSNLKYSICHRDFLEKKIKAKIRC